MKTKWLWLVSCDLCAWKSARFTHRWIARGVALAHSVLRHPYQEGARGGPNVSGSELRACHLCGEPVESGPDKSRWGMNWRGSQWIHYRCAEDLGEAACRVQGKAMLAGSGRRAEEAERALREVGVQRGREGHGHTA